MGSKSAILLAALISLPLRAQDYNPTLIPSQILGSPQTMIPLNGGDDSTRRVSFAFPFDFYGQTFTSAWVSSNGFVSFQSASHLCCNGVPIEQAQRNTIYGYWTDLIGNPNPYYRMTETSALFGWYNTKEFGTNNSVTFEIALFSSGDIQLNYGSVANTAHTVSAGIAGPTSSDNVQLFFGTNVQPLAFQSGLLSPVLPTPPEPTFSPVTVTSSPAPAVAPNPLTVVAIDREAQIVITQDDRVLSETVLESAAQAQDAAPVERALAEENSSQADPEPEPESEPEVKSEDKSEPAPELKPDERAMPEPADAGQPKESGAPTRSRGPASAAISAATEAAMARRDVSADPLRGNTIGEEGAVSRETVLQTTVQNVALLAQADAQYVKQFGEQSTTETEGKTYSLTPTDKPIFASAAATDSPALALVPVPGMVNMTAPMGQMQQTQLLNMGMQGGMSVGEPKDIGDVSSQDAEAMVQLTALPEGYGGYTQARIPDAAFYQPRDIYKGRRIPDQNMALYRLMRGQDALWNAIVDAQYER